MNELPASYQFLLKAAEATLDLLLHQSLVRIGKDLSRPFDTERGLKAGYSFARDFLT